MLRGLWITIFAISQSWVLLAQSRPNIVLIVADDHGREAVGCYGNKVVRTPNIDRLAADGTRFANAFCTTASCSPSRSVLLTGLHNHANGMYGLEHREHHFHSFDTIRSLPVLLEQAGYRTARIGKFHVAPESVYHFQQVLKAGGTNDPTAIGRSPVEMADLCRPFMAEASERPFFLYVASDDPHRSNAVAADGSPIFDTPNQPNSFGNRAQGYPGINTDTYRPEDVIVPSFLPDTKATRAELAQYYQSISRLDQGVGRLIDHLKATNQYDNTLIIYLADNGAAFAGAKTTLYEPGMRLPCIVKPPKPAKPGYVQQAMISWVDITPTLLDYAGVAEPNVNRQGRSFKNMLEQDAVTGWDEVYGSHTLHEVTMYYPMRVLRERRFKLIYNIAYQLPFPMALDLKKSLTWQYTEQSGIKQYGKRTVAACLHRPQFELYDLENDPDESRNLADSPTYRAMLERMKQKLRSFQVQTKDSWVSKWDYD
ncbi:sulfatase family protein [Spirosoma soli]